MRKHSEKAWAIASRFSAVLASETRDLAAAIDEVLPQWQPIETAPKDGTKVDLWCIDRREKYAPRRLTERRYGRMTNWVGEEVVGWNIGDPYRDWQATHWMPLPQPPETTR